VNQRSFRNDSLKKFPLPSGWTLKISDKAYPVLKTKEGLSLSLDFFHYKALSQKQALAKAIGFKKQPLKVLDVTAGWAKDAFLISKLGCFVTAVESHPFVFHFVQESLAFKNISSLKLNFILDNSLNYLNTFKQNQLPDVIFMDPMFGDKKKSLSQKSLRILKELVGETKNQKSLFELALKKAKKRVVVKRHHKDTPLQTNCLCSFKSRSICYDVFQPLRG